MQLSPSSNPALVRTSTMHPSPTVSHTAIPVTQQFNPYAVGNAKAMLKLDGDLGTMTRTGLTRNGTLADAWSNFDVVRLVALSPPRSK